MSSTAASSDELAAACRAGDMTGVKAAISVGASVHVKGHAPGWSDAVEPLRAAIPANRLDIVVLPLSHGADPNADGLLVGAAWNASPDILQVLIDAGGDVNGVTSSCRRLLVWAIASGREESVGVLLAHPATQLTCTYNGATMEQYAQQEDLPAIASAIVQEVGGWGGGADTIAELGMACCRYNCESPENEEPIAVASAAKKNI